MKWMKKMDDNSMQLMKKWMKKMNEKTNEIIFLANGGKNWMYSEWIMIKTYEKVGDSSLKWM